MNQSVRLVVHGLARAERTYTFTHFATLIAGRGADCDLRIDAEDMTVSRRHCRFEISPPGVRVVDLESRNGIHVNGVKVTSSVLEDGDEVRIGHALIRVLMPGAAQPDCPGYELIRELGRGSQGVVYLAHDERGGSVAVKILLPEAVIDPYARGVFLREMDNTRVLRHPNVVEFRGSGTAGPMFFLVCEYCGGGNLDGLVARHGGTLPIARAVPIAAQVLDALAYIHGAAIPAIHLADGNVEPGRGLVHRDVKPENILLSSAADPPSIKVADFGLAKAFEKAGLSGHTWTGAVGGSVRFMPRSQVVNYKLALPGVDLWSAAACLYWMITGATPRDFPDEVDPFTVVLREPVVPIRDRSPCVPPGLADVLDEMLAGEALGSTASALELKDAILEAL
jgi:eukaryotic-like serine/threonine-protein kinase